MRIDNGRIFAEKKIVLIFAQRKVLRNMKA